MKKILLVVVWIISLMSSNVMALTLDEARSQGRVGETLNGYLVALKTDAETQTLVKDINEARNRSYQQLAKQNNVSTEDIAKLAGQKLVERAKPGEFVQGIIDQEVKSLIERNYNRARQLLNDNLDILHAMKDALMKYETIDAPQIDDLMARRDVRPPAGWEEPGASNNSGDNGSPKAPRPVDEPRTPNPGNTMSEQLGDK